MWIFRGNSGGVDLKNSTSRLRLGKHMNPHESIFHKMTHRNFQFSFSQTQYILFTCRCHYYCEISKTAVIARLSYADTKYRFVTFWLRLWEKTWTRKQLVKRHPTSSAS